VAPKAQVSGTQRFLFRSKYDSSYATFTPTLAYLWYLVDIVHKTATYLLSRLYLEDRLPSPTRINLSVCLSVHLNTTTNNIKLTIIAKIRETPINTRCAWAGGTYYASFSDFCDNRQFYVIYCDYSC
jgi:hypothetical protein